MRGARSNNELNEDIEVSVSTSPRQQSRNSSYGYHSDTEDEIEATNTNINIIIKPRNTKNSVEEAPSQVFFNEESAEELIRKQNFDAINQENLNRADLEAQRIELDAQRQYLADEKERVRQMHVLYENERRSKEEQDRLERNRREELDRNERLIKEKQEQYNQSQQSLDATFERYFLGGLFLKGTGAYLLAIDSFNEAIKIMEAYAANWKNRGDNFFFTCDHAENNIAKAKLEIAECLYYRKDYVAAFKTYGSLNNNKYILVNILSKKQDCKNKINDLVNDVVNSVATTVLDTSYNYNNLVTAKEQLRKADEMLKAVDMINSRNLQQQHNRIWWIEAKDDVNRRCEKILVLTTNLADYKETVTDMRCLLDNYNKADIWLSETEVGMRRSLQNKLPAFEAELNKQLERERREMERLRNIACQNSIHKHISELEIELKNAKLPQALVRLESIILLEQKISNKSDVINAEVEYIPKEEFLAYKEYLKSELNEYNRDIHSRNELFVDKIIKEVAMSKNKIIRPADISELKRELSLYLNSTWHKFYKLDLPVEMRNLIARRISSNLETLGVFGTIYKYMTWSYVDLCVKGSVENLMTLIKQDIHGFEMPDRTSPVIEIPHFCIPMAEVVRNESHQYNRI